MTFPRIVIAAGGAPEARIGIRQRALSRGFDQFLLDRDEPSELPSPARIYRRSGDAIVDATGVEAGGPVPIESVADPNDLARAIAAGRKRGVVAVRWHQDRVIPTETAVATAAPRTQLWVVTNHVEDVPAALGALERGVDLVFVELDSPEQVDALEARLEAAPLPPLVWARRRIESVGTGGVGDRVILDFTSHLTPEEGVLVGSSAGFLFHVASEAEGSAFSRPRRFRVNAGAAHSYTLMADGTTRYLSEVEPGDQVHVTVAEGGSRPARIGRVKIERRPLVLVRAVASTRRFTVFLQEAETVRLSTASGRVAVTSLLVGSEALGARLPAGRHLGHAVEESVEER